MGSLAPVLRCLEATLQLPQVCSPKLLGKRSDGCHSVFASNLNRIRIVFEETCSREINFCCHSTAERLQALPAVAAAQAELCQFWFRWNVSKCLEFETGKGKGRPSPTLVIQDEIDDTNFTKGSPED